VICHGDLHPFNLLVEESGDVVVVDWTAAVRAEPAYDVAFTAMLLAHPPLDAPGPLQPIIRWVGWRLARRFVTRYRALAVRDDLGALDWYRALHGTRILLEAASLDARDGPSAGRHPFHALVPVAVAAVSAVTGTPITTPRRSGVVARSDDLRGGFRTCARRRSRRTTRSGARPSRPRF
jgi:aminoglycoside phosphotransferase (APT) family kinase protein